MRLKADVVLDDVIWEGAIIIEECLRIVAPDVECVITERWPTVKHMDGSLHDVGDALDWRTRELTEGQQLLWVALCEERLPDWDILLEKKHLHTEFDPKRSKLRGGAIETLSQSEGDEDE